MAADGRVLVLAFAAHLVGMLAAAGLFVFILRGQPAGGHPDRGSGDDDRRGRGPDRPGPPLPAPTAGAPPLPDAWPTSARLRGTGQLGNLRPSPPRRPARHREPIRQPVDSA